MQSIIIIYGHDRCGFRSAGGPSADAVASSYAGVDRLGRPPMAVDASVSIGSRYRWNRPIRSYADADGIGRLDRPPIGRNPDLEANSPCSESGDGNMRLRLAHPCVRLPPEISARHLVGTRVDRLFYTDRFESGTLRSRKRSPIHRSHALQTALPCLATAFSCSPNHSPALSTAFFCLPTDLSILLSPFRARSPHHRVCSSSHHPITADRPPRGVPSPRSVRGARRSR